MAEIIPRYRALEGAFKVAVLILPGLAIGLAVYYLFRIVISNFVLFDIAYYYLLIGLVMPIIFLNVPMTRQSRRDKVPWYDVVAAILSLVIPCYLFVKAAEIVEGFFATQPPMFVYPLMVVLLVLIIEAARRQAGTVFACICAFFSLYPLFANYMPWLLNGLQFSIQETLCYHVMGSEGILGVPMRVVGGLIIGYLLFAAALLATGGGQFFTKLAVGLMGHVRGGPAKVSVVASSLFGSISGSAIANVAVDGGITIPLMMRTGFPGYYAAAVEATASTGGVMLPPIMGATAFVLAEFVGVSYATVCIAAAIPSVLFYLALFVQIDCRAAKTGMKGLSTEDVVSIKAMFKEGYVYLLALCLLIYFLIVMRMEVKAPFYVTLVLLFLPMLLKERGVKRETVLQFLEASGKLIAEVMAPLLGIGIIINALVITGVAGGISIRILDMAGGNLYLLLLLGFGVAFVLGMGISITAVYVLLALLLAPALVKFGLHPLAVHLFVMYCGMVSYITPPVCAACFTAAPFGGAKPMRVGLAAMRLGVGIYLIPFCFVVNPALILSGSIGAIVFSIGTITFGLVTISGAFEGYLYGFRTIPGWSRIPLFGGGVLLTLPWLRESLVGFVVVFAVLIALYLVKRKNTKRGRELMRGRLV